MTPLAPIDRPPAPDRPAFEGVRWLDPRTRGLRRLALTRALKDPATLMFLACALPVMIVVPIIPLVLLGALCVQLALWRVKYLEFFSNPPEGLCPACLYNTLGLAVPTCPECGLKLPTTRATQ